MNNKILQAATEEKDLVIIIGNDIKTSKQSTAATNKINRILRLINRTFTFKYEAHILKLYKLLVFIHLYSTV